MGRRLTAAQDRGADRLVGYPRCGSRRSFSMAGPILLASVAFVASTGCETTSLRMHLNPQLDVSLASQEPTPAANEATAPEANPRVTPGAASEPAHPVASHRPPLRNEPVDVVHRDFAGSLMAARAAALEGNEEAAVATLHLLLEEYPQRYEPYHHLAVLADCDGRDGEAVILYRQAADLHECDPEVFYDLGLFLLDRGRLAEAEPALVRATELAPTKSRYRRELVTLYARQGRYDDALAQLAFGQSKADALCGLSTILVEQNDAVAAEKCLLLAVEVDPNHEASWRALHALDQQRLPEPRPGNRSALAGDGIQPIASSLSVAPEDVHSPRPIAYEVQTSDLRSHVYPATMPLR